MRSFSKVKFKKMFFMKKRAASGETGTKQYLFSFRIHYEAIVPGGNGSCRPKETTNLLYILYSTTF